MYCFITSKILVTILLAFNNLCINHCSKLAEILGIYHKGKQFFIVCTKEKSTLYHSICTTSLKIIEGAHSLMKHWNNKYKKRYE